MIKFEPDKYKNAASMALVKHMYPIIYKQQASFDWDFLSWQIDVDIIKHDRLAELYWSAKSNIVLSPFKNNPGYDGIQEHTKRLCEIKSSVIKGKDSCHNQRRWQFSKVGGKTADIFGLVIDNYHNQLFEAFIPYDAIKLLTKNSSIEGAIAPDGVGSKWSIFFEKFSGLKNTAKVSACSLGRDSEFRRLSHGRSTLEEFLG